MKISSSNRGIGTLILWLLTVLASFGALPEDPADYAEWEARMLNAISHHASRGDAQAYQKLAGYVFKMSISTNREEADRPVFSAAQQALLSLPHHADYFRDELERAINLEFAQARHEPGAWETRSGSLRYNVFKTLEQLPSPQVIALLGELLDDDRDPWKDWPASDTPPPNPNYYFACKALNAIGLQKAPVDDDLGNDAKIQAVRHSWQLWFAQVEAGTRTFRFEGDPQTYALSGPVQTEPAATRPNRRDPLPPQEAATESDQGGLPWFPVTASLLLLLAAGGWYFKSRKVT